jgi:hypothetical protein
MSSIGSVSMAGLQAATAQFQTSANNIAKSGTSSDMAGDIVDAIAAKASVSISMEMIKSEQKMTQALIDILV